MPNSPFSLLGLSDDATVTMVRAAWRLKVAAGAHPDHGGSLERFTALSDAYHKALKIAENAPCPECRGEGKIGTGHTSFVKTLLRCTACGGSGKRDT